MQAGAGLPERLNQGMATRSRRGTSRRPRFGRKGPAWSWPAAAGVALAIIAFALVAALVLLRPETVPRDPETLCPEAGPSRVTAILLDTTDRVGPTSRADILARLDDLVASSRADEMMVAYETSRIARDGTLFPPKLTVCNPGDPDAANPLISNPELIRRRLEEGFRRPLDMLFRELLDRNRADVSPLLENVQAIAVTLFARRVHAETPKRLIVVSDLMQHSQHLSLYRGRLDYDAFDRTVGADALRTNLRDVEIEVLFVRRREHDRFDGVRSLIDFWERWFEAQGGRLERASRIDGLN